MSAQPGGVPAGILVTAPAAAVAAGLMIWSKTSGSEPAALYALIVASVLTTGTLRSAAVACGAAAVVAWRPFDAASAAAASLISAAAAGAGAVSSDLVL